MVIQIDTREKQSNVINYFDKIGQKYIISKMISGDYQDVNSIRTLIDLKQSGGDGIAELCANLTRINSHERIKKEIQRAKDIGCERFVFLIVHPTIRSIDEVHTWVNKRGQVKPDVLEKIMKTFQQKYGVYFAFTSRQKVGEMIIRLLQAK